MAKRKKSQQQKTDRHKRLGEPGEQNSSLSHQIYINVNLYEVKPVIRKMLTCRIFVRRDRMASALAGKAAEKA